MKKLLLLSLLTFFIFEVTFAQTYTTPNTGVNWTLNDIVTASPSTMSVSGINYIQSENLVIAENDILTINDEVMWLIKQDLLITVFGTLIIDNKDIVISAFEVDKPFMGFRFEDSSNINIQKATIASGGGLRVLTENFILNDCFIGYHVAGATTSAAVQLSLGMPQITNNTFSENDLPAIGSAANAEVSANISGNFIRYNNQSNSNRPQINMGTTMVNEPLRIINNSIEGDVLLDMVGGIAVANLVGGTVNTIIEGNTIFNNRYGMTIIGSNATAVITNNIFEDNNTQNLPNLGGSGISLNTSSGTMDITATGNQFRRNLWGITLIGNASINLGDDVGNPGMNVFSENGNDGVTYALYNNTRNTISAKNNCWIEGQLSTEQEVEDVIFHIEDEATLGEVIFNPFICSVLSIAENQIEDFNFYPNPAEKQINFNNIFSFEKVEIYGIQGNLITSETISEGQQNLEINLTSGLYFVKFSNNAQQVTKKLSVK